MNSLSAELYQSFRRVHGYVLSWVSVGLAFLVFFIAPDSEIPIKWVVVVGLLLVIMVVVVFDALREALRTRGFTLPSAKMGMPPPGSSFAGLAILLLEESQILGQDALVSIYQDIDGFEQLAGIGFVLNIQQDGMLQILVTRSFIDEKDAFWTGVVSNNATTLGQVTVKPSIPKLALELLESR